MQRATGMDIGPDGVSSFSMEAIRHPNPRSKRMETVFAIARLYWKGIVASLNKSGQEQLQARLRLCPPYQAFKGFTGEEVTKPDKLSDKTLDALCGMAGALILGLVPGKVVKSWQNLAVVKMKVQRESGGRKN